MFNAPPREKEWVSWFYVVAWSIVIFITIPFARALQESITSRWGREVFIYGVIGLLIAVAAVAMIGLLRAGRQASWSGLAWLGAVTAVTVYSAGHMNISPEEAVHFLEYGLLGVLIFRALSHRLRDAGIYAVAVLVGSLVGTADEIIQWAVPRRFFAFADIWLNAYAVILSQVALAKGIQPAFVGRRVAPASILRACPLAGALILALTLCASNTPRVLDWTTTHFPRLAFLNETAGAMTEYGYRHDDPQIGVFFSRMSLNQLREQDERRCAEAAAILDDYASPNDYGKFLRRYPSTGDPFVHEARVHLFRRDHYKAVAWKYKNEPEKCRYHNTVAFRENQILEKYFGETLRRSVYAWKSEDAAALEKQIDPSLRYKSEVSADLLTGFTERQMWAVSLLALVVLGLVYRYYGQE